MTQQFLIAFAAVSLLISLRCEAQARDCFAEAKARGLTSGDAWKSYLNTCFAERKAGASGSSAAVGSAAQTPPGAKQSEMDFFRDLGSGKPEAVAPPPQQANASPFKSSDIADACESQVRNMQIGYRGGLEVYKIDVLSPVKPSQSGLPAMAIPQTDLLYPAKIYVHFKNGNVRQYTQVFVYKAPFGIKCMDAR